jgi:glycosyltransferase involved in cell wall biosynthesis
VDSLLVTAGSPQPIADAIERIVAQPGLAARLARAAFDGALDYSWERRAERLERLFEELAQAR